MPIDIFKNKLCKQPATIQRSFDPGVSSLRINVFVADEK